jgi:alpha/beta superfamily hydrolase
LPEPKKLVVVPGANHLFTGKTDQLGDALVQVLRDDVG